MLNPLSRRRNHAKVSGVNPKNPLHKQLENERFARAISHVEQTAYTIKRLNSVELARLNQMLNGHSEEPWRFDPASIQIPTGKVHQISMMSNPLHVARDILELANQIAVQDLIEGAFQVYAKLVLAHLFNDANRRTAALATLWFMRAHGGDVDAVKLAETQVGDLREESDLQKLRKEFILIAKKA
jgi:prophage maintenance system killer protein